MGLLADNTDVAILHTILMQLETKEGALLEYTLHFPMWFPSPTFKQTK